MASLYDLLTRASPFAGLAIAPVFDRYSRPLDADAIRAAAPPGTTAQASGEVEAVLASPTPYLVANVRAVIVPNPDSEAAYVTGVAIVDGETAYHVHPFETTVRAKRGEAFSVALELVVMGES